jgi:hypothetical protein
MADERSQIIPALSAEESDGSLPKPNQETGQLLDAIAGKPIAHSLRKWPDLPKEQSEMDYQNRIKFLRQQAEKLLKP